MHWQAALDTLLHPLTHNPRAGLVTDMDGTISPIVVKPDQVQVTPANRQTLRELPTCLALVAVVSGRAVMDVRERVGLPDLVYVGNHGFEYWRDGQALPHPEARRFRPALETILPDLEREILPGMWIEDKGVTLSVHYRQTENPPAAAQHLTPILLKLIEGHSLKLFSGRMIIEIRPKLPVNKGSTLQDLVTDYALDAVIYLGDDTTDMDALRMAQTLRQEGRCHAVGLAVLSDDMPDGLQESADLWAYGISDVERFLSWLLAARKASSNCL